MLSSRYDLQPGTVYLFRPDQHVCARWRKPDAAQIRQAMGRALGVKRVLAVGVTREAVPGSLLLAAAGAVPAVSWLSPPGPAGYLPLRIGTTESRATPEAYAKRAERKANFAEKQKRLRQKRDEEKRAKAAEEKRRKEEKDAKNANRPMRGRDRKKLKPEMQRPDRRE